MKILGPGDAKGERGVRSASQRLRGTVAALETADKIPQKWLNGVANDAQ
jgi:hypothetical protein